MKNKHIFIPLFVFLGAGLVSLIASVVDYKAVNPALAYSSQIIQFNFNGASDGVDPNGNRFDPVGFLSDELIEKALQKSNLNNTVEEVRPYIAMENVVPNNILKEVNSYEKMLSTDSDNGGRTVTSKDYHPVRYRFVVYENKMMSKGALNTFVTNITDEYNDMFYETYKKTFVQDTLEDLINIENFDYIYQNQIYTSRLQILMDYAKSVHAEHKDFVADVDGEEKSFNDVIMKADYLIKTDALKIDNIIILNALSTDVDRLKDYYNYLLEKLSYDKAKQTTDYNAITKQLIGENQEDTEEGHKDDYKINPTVYVGTGENVIKVEDDTALTYNNLLSRQISLANSITAIDKTRADYHDILDKLNAAVPGSDAETTVKNMISKLDADYQELDALFQKLLAKYNEKYVKEGVVAKSSVRYTSNSIFSTSFITRAIKIAAPIMLTTMLGIAIFYLVRAVRKEKEPKEAK